MADQISPSNTFEENPAGHLDDLDGALENLNYGDLYVLGKLWVDLVKIGLLGTTWKLVPVVEAVDIPLLPPTPKKPPPMRYKDLPIYKSPHCEYKEYIQSKETTCPKAKVKILHEILYPQVKSARETTQKSLEYICGQFCTIKKDAVAAINENKNSFKKFMRDPDNLVLRQIVLGLGGLTGYYVGSGTRNIPKKLFFTSCGLLAAGALCFPKETDETFRNFTFRTSRYVITLYNDFCGRRFGLGERLPCRDEMSAPAPEPTMKGK